MSSQEKDDYAKEQEARLQHLRNRLADADLATMPSELLCLAQAVAGVEDQEMTCDECRAWLPSYVDAEVGGLAVGGYPEVKRHLDLCSDCEAEYLEILELALVEDAGELPEAGALPVPDLAFLPTPSLSGYVHNLAESLVAATEPGLLTDLRAIADVFFERVAALGSQFTLERGWAPALGFGADEVPEALKLLGATYAVTKAVVDGLSPEEIEVQAGSGKLRETLRHRAEKAAQDVGLGSQQMEGFAKQYAELASRDPQILQELAAHQDG
jgi:hypothetical protein